MTTVPIPMSLLDQLRENHHKMIAIQKRALDECDKRGQVIIMMAKTIARRMAAEKELNKSKED